MKYALFALLLLSASYVHAQEYYFGIQFGSGFATNAGQANLTDIDLTDTLETYEIKAGGFGEGLYINGHIGYQQTDFLAYELGVNYLHGKTITNEENSFTTAVLGGYLSESVISQNIRTVMLSPKIVFMVPNESGLTAYAKIGMTVGAFVRGNYIQNTTSTGGIAGQINHKIERVLKGGVPIGFTSSLGANYQIDERISLLAALNLLNMAYRPYTNTVNSNIFNEVELVETLTVRQRNIVYSNKIEVSDSIDEQRPQQQLAVSLPMSNISFQVGLQVRL